MQPLNRKRKSFTLVELLIVISILAILISTVVLIIDPIKHQKRSRDAVLQETMATVSSVIESYYSLRGTYPTVANSTDFAKFFTDSTNISTSGSNLIITKHGTPTGAADGLNQIIFDAGTLCLSAPSSLDPNMLYEWQPGGIVTLVDSASSCLGG